MQNDHSPCPECNGQRVEADVFTVVATNYGPINGGLKISRFNRTVANLGILRIQVPNSSTVNALTCITCGHMTFYANDPSCLIEETPSEEIPLSTTSNSARLGRFFGKIFRKM